MSASPKDWEAGRPAPCPPPALRAPPLPTQNAPPPSLPLSSPWQIGGHTLTSRFFLGTAAYPSPQVLQDAIAASGAQVVTMGLRRQLAALVAAAVG